MGSWWLGSLAGHKACDSSRPRLGLLLSFLFSACPLLSRRRKVRFKSCSRSLVLVLQSLETGELGVGMVLNELSHSILPDEIFQLLPSVTTPPPPTPTPCLSWTLIEGISNSHHPIVRLCSMNSKLRLLRAESNSVSLVLY